MPMLDIPGLMAALARERPLFHSEADFQHALAWAIRASMPGAGIRLEVPAFEGRRDRLDLEVILPAGRVAIELKYWQAATIWTAPDGEVFNLSSQGAQDMNRAAFAKDLMRVERLLAERRAAEGWVVALTNDANYLAPGRPNGTDAAFRLPEGRVLTGPLRWRAGTADSTTRGTRDVTLRGAYTCRWTTYSQEPGAPHVRMLALEVATA